MRQPGRPASREARPSRIRGWSSQIRRVKDMGPWARGEWRTRMAPPGRGRGAPPSGRCPSPRGCLACPWCDGSADAAARPWARSIQGHPDQPGNGHSGISLKASPDTAAGVKSVLSRCGNRHPAPMSVPRRQCRRRGAFDFRSKSRSARTPASRGDTSGSDPVISGKREERRTFAADVGAGRPTKVCVRGRLLSFPAPTQVIPMIGLYSEGRQRDLQRHDQDARGRLGAQHGLQRRTSAAWGCDHARAHAMS